jgi:antitoxin (DNA-binding transcriptional repressor) of toxin-antitoxin stability system
MPIPKVDFRGRRVTVSMMELRSKPGEVIDSVRNGLVVDIEKNGKIVAVLSRSAQDTETTIIHPDGSMSGQMPLTFRRNLGSGGYGS